MRELLGDCPECGTDLSGETIVTLPAGHHGAACPECGTDVYCPECGDMTKR